MTRGRPFQKRFPDVNGQRRCTKCDAWKPLDDEHFARRIDSSTAFQSWCRKCCGSLNSLARKAHPEKHAGKMRAYWIKTRYNITEAEYEAMYRAQGGVCAICKAVPKPGKKLHIDHDHKTDSLRGLLCFKCNAPLGAMGDSPEVLRAAADYIERHRKTMEERTKESNLIPFPVAADASASAGK